MEQFILFNTIAAMIDNDTVVEVYIKGNTEPLFANRAYLLSSIIEKNELYIDMTRIKISSKFAGYDKAHVVITIDGDIPCINDRKEWWDRLRLATPEEIKEEMERIIKDFLFQKIKESLNEVAISALESGQCDDVIQEAMKQIDYNHIAMSGFTKLDMINARSNPTNSEFYTTIMKSLQSTMKGEDGKAFQDILFG